MADVSESNGRHAGHRPHVIVRVLWGVVNVVIGWSAGVVGYVVFGTLAVFVVNPLLKLRRAGVSSDMADTVALVTLVAGVPMVTVISAIHRPGWQSLAAGYVFAVLIGITQFALQPNADGMAIAHATGGACVTAAIGGVIYGRLRR